MPRYSGRVTVNVNWDYTNFQRRWKDILEDPRIKRSVGRLFAEMCEPYIPESSGALINSVKVTKNYVSWNTPYAHYQYTGMVYGPNFPITDGDGNIVGWYSRRGQKKKPTGARLEYKKPLATDHWDKAMLARDGHEFKIRVNRLIREELKRRK